MQKIRLYWLFSWTIEKKFMKKQTWYFFYWSWQSRLISLLILVFEVIFWRNGNAYKLRIIRMLGKWLMNGKIKAGISILMPVLELGQWCLLIIICCLKKENKTKQTEEFSSKALLILIVLLCWRKSMKKEKLTCVLKVTQRI